MDSAPPPSTADASAGAPGPILFIGDSITDCGRREDPAGLGDGYVRMIVEHLERTAPRTGAAAPVVVNRGVSGDRVRDILARFDADCLDLGPSVVTIFAGVNDTWRRYDRGDPTSDDDMARDYGALLERLAEKRPETDVLVVIPFVLDVTPERARFHEDLDPKVARIRELARMHGAQVVDAEAVMAHGALAHGPAALAPDGIHPSAEGHRLLADAWLDARARQRG